jgi:hypothetical protein
MLTNVQNDNKAGAKCKEKMKGSAPKAYSINGKKQHPD